MKKTIVLWGFVFLALSACTTDEPLLTEIQKVVVVNMGINADRGGSTGQNELFLTATSDIVANDFEEYLDQIRDFQINRFIIQLTSPDVTPGQAVAFFERFDLNLSSVEAGGLTVNMFELSNLALGGEMVLYHKDSVSSSDLNNAINFVRSRLLREQPISWKLSGEVQSSNANEGFGIKLMLDLSAEVILN